jgi:hypothetical protein
MRKITIGFIIGAIVIILGYDVVAAIYGGTGSTISEVITSWSYGTPLLPFAFGVVCGHWFWHGKEDAPAVEDKSDKKE